MERRSTTRRAMFAVMPAVAVFALAACAVGTEEDTGAGESAQSALCGNGERDPGEQCDDGNTSNLDGCDRSCRFEQIHRMSSIEMMWSPDAYCPANALGSAVKGIAQGKLQEAIAKAVSNGSLSILLSFLDLDDLSGQSEPSFTLGSLIGDPMPGVTSGIDAWYSPKPASISTDKEPLAFLPARLEGAGLSAGPGNLAFALDIAGGAANLSMSNARAKATAGASNTPLASKGSSPGHLASERLDPELESFATMTNGQICGNVSAASLAAFPAPSQLTSGSTACAQGYTSANSMLDVFVGGCKILFVNALAAVQPDAVDPAVPVVGAGGPYKLTAGSDKRVNGCRDRSGAAVELGACLSASAYSAAFRFATQRAVVRAPSRTFGMRR